jgi:hypothetical protein
MMKKVYDMNPIAVNYDNETVSPQAKQNMENAVRKLNVGFVSIKSRSNLRKKLIADKIRMNIALNDVNNINSSLCTHCWVGEEATVTNVTIKRRLSLVLYGHSEDEKTVFATNDFENNLVQNDFKTNRMTISNLSSLADKAKTILSPRLPRYVNILYNSRRFARELNYNSNSANRQWTPKFLPLFEYIDHNEKDMVALLKKELDWDKSPEAKIPWRFDCKVAGLSQYILWKQFGFSKFDDHLSKQIRKGLMSRAEALGVVTIEDEESEFEQFIPALEEIGLNSKEIKKLRFLVQNHPTAP